MADNMDFNSTTVFGEVKVLMLKGEKGDTGEDGTSGNYSQLTNKPSINGVTLNGNMTSDALGVASQSYIDALQEDFDALEDELDNPTWTDLALSTSQSAVSKTAFKYKVDKAGEVTLAMNLDFSAHSSGSVTIATLPETITPKNTASGGIGVQRYFPERHSSQGSRLYFRISSTNLYIIFLDAVSNGDYIVCEEKYTPIL